MGGTISAVLFSVGKKLFALYLTHAGTASAFGAAGSLAVLLMWLYFAAAVMLLGAEAAATRVEAREGVPLEGEGQQASQDERRPHEAPMKAPTSARAQHTLAIADAGVSSRAMRLGPRAPSSERAVFAKVLGAVKANPRRFAIAAAGAGLFILTKASGSTKR